MVALVGLGDQFVDLAVGDLRQNAVAFADGQQDGVQHGVDAADDLRIGALELLRLAAVGELAFLGRIGQPDQFLLQALKHDSHVVDRQLHLFVVALVGLRDQFVDLAVRDLRQDAVAFADGQQNRVQHGVHAANDLRVGALELFRLAAVGELSLLGGLDQSRHLLLQPLRHLRHVVDGQLHLFVVALIVLRDQLVDLACRNLRQHAVAFADGKQNRVQHLVDALDDLAMNAVELGCLAAFGEAPILGRIHQAHNFLQDNQRLVFGWPWRILHAALCLVSIPAVPVAGAMLLPAFTYQCSRHEIRSLPLWNSFSSTR